MESDPSSSSPPLPSPTTPPPPPTPRPRPRVFMHNKCSAHQEISPLLHVQTEMSVSICGLSSCSRPIFEVKVFVFFPCIYWVSESGISPSLMCFFEVTCL